MQVSFETIIRRASAEGYTLSKVKSALSRLEREGRQKAVKVAQEGWHGVEMVDDGVVVRQLTSTHYKGGFMYPGSVVTPGQFQERRHSRPGGSTDGDPTGATEWVREAPVGAEVSVNVDFGNGRSHELFRRLEQGWALVHTWDESQEWEAQNGQFPYYGYRADVARELGCGESATFHQLFDLAVEQVFN